MNHLFGFFNGAQKEIQDAFQMDAESMKQLSRMYSQGEGVEKDLTQAWFWARLAGDCGDGQGDYLTGLCYEEGKGVPKNLNKAWAYFERAMRRGCEEAKVHYNATTKHFCPANIQGERERRNWTVHCCPMTSGSGENDIFAVYCLKKAAAGGDPYCNWMLSHMYAQGRGVLLDYSEAIRLGSIAAASNFAYAKEAAEEVAIYRERIGMSGSKLRNKMAHMHGVDGGSLPGADGALSDGRWSAQKQRKSSYLYAVV